MSSDDVKFKEPVSVAEAQLRREALGQRIRELDAELTAVNAERPPRQQSHNYRHWVDRRGGLISTKRYVLAEHQFVKTWLNQTTNSFFDTDLGRPSHELHSLSLCMRRLEELYIAVGHYLESDSDEAYQAVQKAYDMAKAELGDISEDES